MIENSVKYCSYSCVEGSRTCKEMRVEKEGQRRKEEERFEVGKIYKLKRKRFA